MRDALQERDLPGLVALVGHLLDSHLTSLQSAGGDRGHLLWTLNLFGNMKELLQAGLLIELN